MIPVHYSIGEEDGRPWGRWIVLDITPHLVVKKLVVDPGKRISLQRHKYRSERWIVMSGKASVQKDDERMQLQPGEGVLIPHNCLHRLANESSAPVTVLEIQYGELLSEDDIERFDDDFGRTE